MVKRLYILLLSLTLAEGCKQNVDLDMQYLGDSSGAFIECYCQRGELYNLTATYLSPIDVPQNLDYSYKFEAYITDTTKHRLSQGLFEIDKYLYSHGSPKRVPQDFEGELLLDITSEKGDHFTASSALPDELAAIEAEYHDGVVVVEFVTSDDPAQNYYSVAAVASLVDSKKKQSKVELHNTDSGITQRAELDFNDVDEQIDEICVRVIRFTREGYDYQSSIMENIESTSSNLITGTPLKGNIEGCRGIFTCYSEVEITLKVND